MVKPMFLRIVAGCFFILSISIIYVFAYLPDYGFKGTFGLKTIDTEKAEVLLNSGIDSIRNDLSIVPEADSLVNFDSCTTLENYVSAINSTLEFDTYKPDSTKKFNIALIGDSQAGGLIRFLNDYCQENNYRFSFAIVWYSASIFNYAYADTIQHVLNKYKPDFLFVALGLNELWARDLERRKTATIKFLNKINHIPYCFIGPANYMEDKGINNIYASCVDNGKFFLSKDMNLPKGNDGRHPSMAGYKIWMDSIANWMYRESIYHLKMAPPSKKYGLQNIKRINLNAAKYKGY